MELRKMLITGASRGIGRALACKLADCGEYRLVLHAASQASLAVTESMLPQGCQYDVMVCDFTDQVATHQFIKDLKSRHPDVYGIISNAGINRDKPLIYQPTEDIDDLLNVNLRVPVLLAKMAMKVFSKRSEGVFIAMASCVAETGNAFQAVYAATKAANNALCKSLAREAGVMQPGCNTRFVSVSPGFIETDMTGQLANDTKAKYLQQIPSGRFGTAEDVAAAIKFLLSDEASYINGTEFKINGGLV
ncbi:MAG: SDR family oxidoreductase [Taibaiella sp.]|nr:SDR family oxidoreductase [Taibaiella sp.]